jgi:hypothetical protein
MSSVCSLLCGVVALALLSDGVVALALLSDGVVAWIGSDVVCRLHEQFGLVEQVGGIPDSSFPKQASGCPNLSAYWLGAVSLGPIMRDSFQPDVISMLTPLRTLLADLFLVDVGSKCV